MKYTYLLTTLAIGVMVGISIGNYQVIDCQVSSNYCQQLDTTYSRRSF
ncbi:MAG: hypothetical protein JHD34_03410 [Candidatus Nanopelagicus sp.]|nr:hypothetical protein [Candidatus Nanopelagicus sp.]